jgi:MarR family transcriptional regulator, temperature-dependent positive regulator of motility
MDLPKIITERVCDLAQALGVSLGKANYCLKALTAQGLIKIANFRNAQNKLEYACLLTPSGCAEKADITAHFLKHKLVEYERLKHEIEVLKMEIR